MDPSWGVLMRGHQRSDGKKPAEARAQTHCRLCVRATKQQLRLSVRAPEKRAGAALAFPSVRPGKAKPFDSRGERRLMLLSVGSEDLQRTLEGTQWAPIEKIV